MFCTKSYKLRLLVAEEKKTKPQYFTCVGSTWQNMEIFSLTDVSRGVAQRHMIWQKPICIFSSYHTTEPGFSLKDSYLNIIS